MTYKSKTALEKENKGVKKLLALSEAQKHGLWIDIEMLYKERGTLETKITALKIRAENLDRTVNELVKITRQWELLVLRYRRGDMPYLKSGYSSNSWEAGLQKLQPIFDKMLAEIEKKGLTGELEARLKSEGLLKARK